MYRTDIIVPGHMPINNQNEYPVRRDFLFHDQKMIAAEIGCIGANGIDRKNTTYCPRGEAEGVSSVRGV